MSRYKFQKAVIISDPISSSLRKGLSCGAGFLSASTFEAITPTGHMIGFKSLKNQRCTRSGWRLRPSSAVFSFTMLFTIGLPKSE